MNNFLINNTNSREEIFPKQSRNTTLIEYFIKELLLCILLFFMAQTFLIGQTTINLTVAEDNTINNASGGSSRNNGTCENLEFKGTLSYPTLLFDLSSIPSGATIISATLRMNKNLGEAQDVGAHRITTAWTDEGTQCDGSGTPNWSTPWTNAGGDYASPAESTTAITLTNGIYTWDITTMTQDWIDGTFSNYGVQLVPTASVSGIHSFDSKEKVGGTAPELVVTYTTLVLSNTVVSNTCAATPTGAVDLTVAGGTMPFTYNWSNGATTEDLSSISGGTYYVTVTDNTGLMAFDTATVNGPTAIELSTSITTVTTSGANDGAIALTVSGGTSPYSYNWSNGATSEDLSSLAEGTYTVTVTDDCLATAITSATIAPLVNKYLYLSDAYDLDRIDPVATSDITTSSTSVFDTMNTIVDLAPTYDVHLSSVATATQTLGACTSIKVLNDGTDKTNALFSYDISGIPAGATITNAYLSVYNTVGSTSETVGLYRITRNWSYATSTCGDTGFPTYGQAESGVNWTNAGGDFDATAISSTVVTTNNQYYNWDATTLVQDWVAGTYTNSGMILSSISGAGTELIFSSAETGSNPPLLHIEYEVIDTLGLNAQTGENGTITDNLGTGDYMGGASTGTRNWSGGWIENDASGGGATGGNILVSTNTLVFNESLNDDIYREIDLSDATAASLSFDIDEVLSGADLVVFEASNNGGSTYTLLDTYDTNLGITSRTYDLVNLLGAVSGNTRIRFRWTASGNGSGNSLTFDNFSISYTVPPLGTPDTTFVQSIPMCSDFNILAGQDIIVSAYANVTMGTMPASPDIIAVLEYGAGPTLIDTLKNPTWDAGTGLLTWTDQLASDVLIPTGEAISLTIITNETVVTFNIQYDSDTKPSKIQLPTSTYIEITDVVIYDAPYAGGTIITELEAGMTAYIRSTVSDPFGFYDITGMDIDVIDPLTNTTTVSATSVATAGCTRTYEYEWTTPTTNSGDYNIKAIGIEGTEGVTADSTIQFKVISPLQITKTIISPATAPYTLGDNIEYKILIDNQGNTGIASLPIQDIYDNTCLQFISASPAESNVVNGTIIWNDLGPLARTTKDSITVNFMVIGNCDPATNIANIPGAIDSTGNAIALKSDTISVNIDEPPVANDDEFCVSAPQDLDVLANDTDPDADLTTVTITVPAGVGTAMVNPDNTIQYTPGGGMVDNDSDSFTYQVCDNAPVTPYCSTATVTVVYSTINDAPVLTDDFVNTTLDLPFTFSVVSNDTDIDGSIDSTSVAITSGPNFGTASINSDGSIYYVPNPGFYGLDTLTYQVCDNGCPTPIQCGTATAVINVVFVYYVCTSGTSDLEIPAIQGADTYTWDLPTGAVITSSPIDSNEITVDWTAVTPGQYNVCALATNHCGDGTQQCVEIVVTELTLTTQPTDVLCTGENIGAIDLIVEGGVPDYTYNWSNGSSVEDLSAIPAGAYEVTVTDKNGCFATVSETLTEPATALSVTGTTTDENPYGSANGAIDITPVGGVSPYTYNWSNGSINQDLSGLSGGTYIVTLTDINGCMVVETFTVNTIGGPLEVSSIIATDALCNGGSDGTINLEVIGGSGTYTYDWDNDGTGDFDDPQDLTGLAAGTYNVTISDGVNPNITTSAVVTEPATAVTASTTGINVSCNGNTDGSVDLTASGGTGVLSYNWSTGDASEDLMNVAAGTYDVTVTDENGCTATAQQIITEPIALTASGVTTDTPCEDGNTGAIDLSVAGGSPTYTFAWSNGATSEDLSSLTKGNYAVTITDMNGCSLIKSFTIESVCIGLAKTVLETPVNNNDGTYTLDYQIKIKNEGTTNLSDIQVTEDLNTTFTSATGYTMDAIFSTDLSVNNLFNGNMDTDLLATSQGLAVGDSALVTITITVTPGNTLGIYDNTVSAEATGGSSVITRDTSQNGNNTDPEGDGAFNNSDPTPITFTESPVIGVAKTITSGPTNNGDGTYDLSYQILIRNMGDVPLSNVQVTDTLSNTFNGAIVVVNNVTSPDLVVNYPGYDGTTNYELLAGSDDLLINEIDTIHIDLTITPGTNLGVYNNTAIGMGEGPGGTTTTDESQDGTDMDPTDGAGGASDGDPTNDDVPTPVTFPENPEIGVAKSLVGMPINNGDGTYTLSYQILVANTGDVPLTNVQVSDSLDNTFNGATVAIVSLSSPDMMVNFPSYDGTSDYNLLAGTDGLIVGQQDTINLTLTVTPGTDLGPYNNTAIGQGTSTGGTVVTDESHDGGQVDPENDGTADNNTPTPVTFTENPEVGIAKSVYAAPVSNNDSTYTLTYLLLVENTGDVPLINVQITDNLNTTFTAANAYTVDNVTSPDLSVNFPGYNGNTEDTLLSATDIMQIGEIDSVFITVTVEPGTTLGIYNNTATVNANGAGGTSVTDDSYDGINNDPDRNGDPTDNTLATPVSFIENPQLGVAKVLASSVDNMDGTYTVAYDIKVKNIGDVFMKDIHIVDDLSQTFTNAASFMVTGISSTHFNENTSYDGSTDIELLADTPNLAVGDSGIVSITVVVDPGDYISPFYNKASAYGTTPAGAFILDNSTDGTDVDPDGDGDTGNNSTPTPVQFPAAIIGAAKQVTSGPSLLSDGLYRVTYQVKAANLGNFDLYDVQLFDTLTTDYGTYIATTPMNAGEYTISTPPSLDLIAAGSAVTLSSAFTGAGSTTSLIDYNAGDILEMGDSVMISFSIDFRPTVGQNTFNNQMVAAGDKTETGALDRDASDLSDDGTLVDEDGDGIPTEDLNNVEDNSSENDPTVFILDYTPIAYGEDTTILINTMVTIAVIENDTFGNDGLVTDSISITSNPTNGIVTIDDNGTPNDPTDDTIDYTPNTGFTGADSLIYEICDIDLDCDTALVIINIIATNAPPVADNDTTQTNEDTPVTLNALLDDYDIDGNLHGDSLTILTPPMHGLASEGSDSTVTYTPEANFFGIDSIQYEICDTSALGSLCDTAWIFITVNPINDPPVADNDTTQTNEDTPVTLNALLDDYDVDGNLHGDSLTILTLPMHGMASEGSDSTVTYTPEANFFGIDSIQYEICDTSALGSLCDTAWIFITVNPVNDPPVADNDTTQTNEDTPVTLNALLDDYDIDGNLHGDSLTILTLPMHGMASEGSDSTVTYTPEANFFGIDSIQYEICDTSALGSLCDTAWIFITVNPVNDPPVADNDTTQTNEDTPVTLNALLDDYDIDGNLHGDSLTILTLPMHGMASEGSDSTVTYTPEANFFGIDSIQYEICDTSALGSLCDTAWIFITVNPVNDPPVADNDTTMTAEDTPVTLNALLDDYDIDGNLHGDSLTILTPPMHGMASEGSDSTVTYTPAANFFGLDSIQYEICDTSALGSLCDTAWIFITVNPINDPPVADNDTTMTAEDTPVTINALLDDYDIDGNLHGDSLTILTLPMHGVASEGSDSTVTYTPEANFFGIDSIQYEICDTSALGSLCDTAWIFITVNPVNDPPVADNDTTMTAEDTPVTLNALLDDYDIDGNLHGDSLTILTLPMHGIASEGSDSTVTYTPEANFFGLDSIQYEICDTSALGSLCDTAWIFITVNPINDPPVADNDTTQTNEDTPVTLNALLDDYDIDGNLHGDSLTILTLPMHGVASEGSDSTVTYTPNMDFVGIDSIQYEICDTSTLGSLCDTAWIFITVNPVNDPPVADNDTTQTNEDTPVTLNALLDDYDIDGNLHGDSLTILTLPMHGVASEGSDSTVTYTPEANFFGLDSIQYEICDTSALGSLCDTAWIFITVNPVNDPPVADNDTTQTNEDTPVTLNALLDDYDIDGNLHGDSLTIITPPMHGVASEGSDSTVTYTPEANFFGLDSIQYEICDTSALGSLCDTAWIFITVNPVNDPPVADNDTTMTAEDTPITLNALLDDYDIDGNLHGDSLTIITLPMHGIASEGSDSTVTYTPEANFFGIDSIQYEICDTSALGSLCDTAWIFITVNPVNDPPVADNDTTQTNEDTPVTLNALLDDYDIDGNLHGDSLTILTLPMHGIASEGSDSTVTYTPEANFFGLDSIQYEICDTSALGSLCDTAWIFITVNPVNDPPVADNDTTQTNEDTPVTLNALLDDYDIDGNLHGDSLTILTLPMHGIASKGSDSTVTYTPEANFFGLDSIQYEICDTSALGSLCDTAWIFITVNPVNDPPVADNDTTMTAEDTPVTLNALLDDYDIDGNLHGDSLTIITPPMHGIASEGSDSTVTYTPEANFFGIDSIQYEICDTSALGSLCDTAWIFITVNPVNDPPVADNDTTMTAEDTPVTLNALLDDYDIDGNLHGDSLTIITPPMHGIASEGSDSTVTYTPEANFFGIDSIQYEICDTSALGSLCDTAWIFITVNPVNDPPVADNDTTQTNEDTPVTLNALLDDYDIDGNLHGDSLTILTLPMHGMASEGSDSTVTYTPEANFFGLDSIQYEICDTSALGSLCDTAWIFITVNPVNDPPVADNDTTMTAEDTPVTLNALLDDYDIDGNLHGDSLTILTLPMHGLASEGSDSTVTYTPEANFFGIDSIQYEICDTSALGSLCDTAWIFITVNPVNDPPVADNDTTQTNEDTPVTLNALLDDYDIDGNLHGDSLTIITPPMHGIASEGSDSTVTYTPEANFFGIDSIQYEICDTSALGSLCDTAWIFITVNPVNDPPIADNDTTQTNEDTPVTLNALLDDYDIDGNLHGDSLTILTLPMHGMASEGSDSTVTYTPNMDFVGIDSIQYEICDTSALGSLCDTAWIFITVNPINDPPVADNDTTQTNEDTPVTLNALLDDYDIDGNLHGDSLTILTLPMHGIANEGSDSTVTYTPEANFFGLDSIQYEICDTSALGSLCDTAWIFITVNPVNDPPVADNDTTQTNEDTPVTLNALLDDYDIDGNLHGDSLTILTLPMHGIASEGSDSTVTYTPEANFFGIDSIQYEICDTSALGSLCDTAWIFITVNPVNDPPVADNDTTMTAEDTPVTLNALLDDYDVDGNLHGDSLTILTLPMHGIASEGSDSTVTYTPEANFFGIDSIQYEICDTSALESLCDTAWIFITVNPVNDPPVADNDTTQTNEDTPVTLNALLDDYDIDGNLHGDSLTILTLPMHGVASEGSDSTVTYTPEANFFGLDSIQYEICDTSALGSLCDTAWIFITVNPVNDPPVADNDTTMTAEDTPVTLNALLDDYDVDGNLHGDSLTILTPPMHGMASEGSDSTVTYTPNMDFVGIDSIQYEICDTSALGSLCDTAWIYINVIEVNSPPTQGNETAYTPQDSTIENIDLLDNNTDPDMDLLMINPPATSSQGGIIMDNGDGTVDYTPPSGFSGQDTVIYTVCDPSLACVTDTLFITVGGCLTINTSVYLEGSWNGTEMYTKLNDLGYLPGQKPSTFFGTYTTAGQPYGVAPWNYAGTEGINKDYTVSGIPDAGYPVDAVDWVLVSLRTGTTDATTVCQRAGLLHADGRITFESGFDCCDLNPFEQYYLVIEHRNHLIVMSHEPVGAVNDTITYDFRIQQSFTNLFGFGQKEIRPGVFVMFAGNGEQANPMSISADTDINVGDKTTWLDENGDHSSYYFQDFDMNGDSNVQDKNLWLENNGKFSDVPRN